MATITGVLQPWQPLLGVLFHVVLSVPLFCLILLQRTVASLVAVFRVSFFPISQLFCISHYLPVISFPFFFILTQARIGDANAAFWFKKRKNK